MKTKPQYRDEATESLYKMALDLEKNTPFPWLLPLTSAVIAALEAGNLEAAFDIFDKIGQEAYKQTIENLDR